MTEANQSAEETYDLDGGGGSSYENPWIERTLGREAFYPGASRGGDPEYLKKDGEARCFVIRRLGAKNIYGGPQFWMQVSVRDDLTIKAAPFYSSVRLNEGWTYQTPKKNPTTKQVVINPKTGKPIMRNVIGLGYPPVDRCALAKLVKTHPELIAPLKFNGQIQYWPAKNGQPAEPKQDYKKLFAVEAFEVLFEYAEVPDPAKPGMLKRIVVLDPVTKKPKYTVNPRPFIFELNETWWEQYRSKILYPQLAEAASAPADIDAAQGAAPKKLPSEDKTQIVLKLFAKTDELDPSRAKYVIDFSAALTIDSKAIVPVDELPSKEDGSIDWEQIYKPMDQETADKLVQRAMGLDEAQPEQQEEGHSASAPATSEAAGSGAAEDDIPF